MGREEDEEELVGLFDTEDVPQRADGLVGHIADLRVEGVLNSLPVRTLRRDRGEPSEAGQCRLGLGCVTLVIGAVRGRGGLGDQGAVFVGDGLPEEAGPVDRLDDQDPSSRSTAQSLEQRRQPTGEGGQGDLPAAFGFAVELRVRRRQRQFLGLCQDLVSLVEPTVHRLDRFGAHGSPLPSVPALPPCRVRCGPGRLAERHRARSLDSSGCRHHPKPRV